MILTGTESLAATEAEEQEGGAILYESVSELANSRFAWVIVTVAPWIRPGIFAAKTIHSRVRAIRMYRKKQNEQPQTHVPPAGTVPEAPQPYVHHASSNGNGSTEGLVIVAPDPGRAY